MKLKAKKQKDESPDISQESDDGILKIKAPKVPIVKKIIKKSLINYDSD